LAIASEPSRQEVSRQLAEVFEVEAAAHTKQEILAQPPIRRFGDLDLSCDSGVRHACGGDHGFTPQVENRAIPTVTQLAGYVNQDGTAATDGTDGVGITIDGTAFEVKTFSDNGCNNATTATAPNDRVLCVGGIGTP